ncbi:uncharacterized protein SOCE26_079690 [Sorangium cellulosum]|uniref:Uncharacterized protein n=1 Tax=Sorangium cellulosum TaxID=56 RepID=A0A2L0F4J5_SORCE|nr:uncharacterized protein SOCE26_079690 [Sorangium cellulosum]
MKSPEVRPTAQGTPRKSPSCRARAPRALPPRGAGPPLQDRRSRAAPDRRYWTTMEEIWSSRVPRDDALAVNTVGVPENGEWGYTVTV